MVVSGTLCSPLCALDSRMCGVANLPPMVGFHHYYVAPNYFHSTDWNNSSSNKSANRIECHHRVCRGIHLARKTNSQYASQDIWLHGNGQGFALRARPQDGSVYENSAASNVSLSSHWKFYIQFYRLGWQQSRYPLIVAVITALIKSVPTLCSPEDPAGFTCPGVNVFFRATVIWGVSLSKLWLIMSVDRSWKNL